MKRGGTALVLLILFTACVHMDRETVFVKVPAHSLFMEGERVALIQPVIRGLDSKKCHDLLASLGQGILPGRFQKAPFDARAGEALPSLSTLSRLSRQVGGHYALVVTGEYSGKNMTSTAGSFPDYSGTTRQRGYYRLLSLSLTIRLYNMKTLSLIEEKDYSRTFETAPMFDLEEAGRWDEEAAFSGLADAFRHYLFYLKGETKESPRIFFTR
ncbi:MAG TPA: hypothetical protein PLF44_06280 [Candidatus Mcinerneyibacteriales bacterium]|nr:hypothetical protein [Candidatus Mcinerneyibacteriales bacterium]